MKEEEEEEVTATKSKIDEWRERRKTKNPDKAFENEDDYYSAAMEEEDLVNGELTGRKDKEQSLVELIAQHPQLGALLANLKNMKDSDAATSLLKMYGEDFKASLDSEEAIKAMAESQAERMEREAKSKAFTEKCEKDFDERLDMISSFCESKGLSEGDATTFMGDYLDFCYRGSTSQFDESDLEAYHKGVSYDNAIQEAETKGEVKGANKKIELKKKEEQPGEVPLLGSQPTGEEEKKSKRFQKKSIWE